MISRSDKLINRILVGCINFYQKNISPHKGYCCAHRSLHGSLPCSGYAKSVLLENNLYDAIKLSNQRFKECSQAEVLLRNRLHESSPSTQVANNSLKIDGYARLSRRSYLAWFFLSLITFLSFGLISVKPASASSGSMIARGCKGTYNGGNNSSNSSDDGGIPPGVCCGGIGIGVGIANAVANQK